VLIAFEYESGFSSSVIIPLSPDRNSFAYSIGLETHGRPQPIAYERVPLTIWFLSRFVQMYMSVARRYLISSF